MKCLFSLPSRISCFFKGHKVEKRATANGWVNRCDRCGDLKAPTLPGLWHWFWGEIE